MSLQGVNKLNNWFTVPTTAHIVHFYNSESDLLSPLSEFVSSGLINNETCIVIATPSHAQNLSTQLNMIGIDIMAMHEKGTYIVLDAADTLASFMVNDLPDRERFFEVIGSLIEKYARDGQPIRAYGEMVALLWRDGNREAVIALEELWNELGDRYTFSLFCAYPKLHFFMDSEVMDEIQHHHDALSVPVQ